MCPRVTLDPSSAEPRLIDSRCPNCTLACCGGERCVAGRYVFTSARRAVAGPVPACAPRTRIGPVPWLVPQGFRADLRLARSLRSSAVVIDRSSGCFALVTAVLTLGASCRSMSTSNVDADAERRSLSACVDVVFTRAADEPSGMVACPVEGDEFNADIYSTAAEACEGRGHGRLLAIRCASDADCARDGSCLSSSGFCAAPVECDSGQECGAGRTCACAGTFGQSTAVGWNQCVPTECRSAAECGGYPCGLSNADPCGQLDGFYCHSERDECSRSSDCGSVDELCAYDRATLKWRCRYRQRICESGL